LLNPFINFPSSRSLLGAISEEFMEKGNYFMNILEKIGQLPGKLNM
jgi:hypothetical protein